MSRPHIEVHIEELVLHGFPHSTRWQVAEALERQLHALLAEAGLPHRWHSSVDKIEATSIQADAQARPTATGEQIARAIYGGSAQ